MYIYFFENNLFEFWKLLKVLLYLHINSSNPINMKNVLKNVGSDKIVKMVYPEVNITERFTTQYGITSGYIEFRGKNLYATFSYTNLEVYVTLALTLEGKHLISKDITLEEAFQLPPEKIKVIATSSICMNASDYIE